MAQSPRPAPSGTVPLAPSEAPRPQPALRIPVGMGHSYRHRKTGRIWTITGLSSGRRAVLTSGPEHVYWVCVDTKLPDQYEHIGCDHDGHCCALHGTHVMPHRGCVLR